MHREPLLLRKIEMVHLSEGKATPCMSACGDGGDDDAGVVVVMKKLMRKLYVQDF